MSVVRILSAYRLIFCALILVASIQTLAQESGLHVAVLASVEVAGALMLAWRRTQWFGAALLLVVFAGAQMISAFEGEYPTRFLQFGASTILIVLLDRVLPQVHAGPRD